MMGLRLFPNIQSMIAGGGLTGSVNHATNQSYFADGNVASACSTIFRSSPPAGN
jgi:hypothetical protein